MSDEQVERIIVTVDDQNLSVIESVVTALESAGMKVDRVLPVTGIITGEVAQSKLEGLRSVPGVANVEVDREMQAI
jgi:enamine deaminase RidA (YjgF/YER057c/UK114 family)